MKGSTALMQRKVLLRFTLMMRTHRLIDISAMLLSTLIPALLARISMHPYPSSVLRSISLTSSSFIFDYTNSTPQLFHRFICALSFSLLRFSPFSNSLLFLNEKYNFLLLCFPSYFSLFLKILQVGHGLSKSKPLLSWWK